MAGRKILEAVRWRMSGSKPFFKLEGQSRRIKDGRETGFVTIQLQILPLSALWRKRYEGTKRENRQRSTSILIHFLCVSLDITLPLLCYIYRMIATNLQTTSASIFYSV